MITYPNLYHLKYFVDAVELGSVSGAAQRNLVTHPAISRAISALEAHLGVELLEHQKKAFRLTDAGYRVAEQARVLLSAASDFEILSLKSQNAETVRLKIGMSKSLSRIYLSPILQNLKKKFPNSTAQVFFGTTSEIIKAVADRSLDLGLTIGNQRLATLNQKAVSQGRFLLVESGPKKEWRADLESSSFILTEPRVETEKLKAGYKKHYGRDLPVLFEIRSWEVIGQLVQKGLGIGLLPDLAVQNWKKEDFRVVKASWFECAYEIYVHNSKDQGVNRVIRFVQDLIVNGR